MISNQLLKGRILERLTDEEFFHFCQDNRTLKFERDAKGLIFITSPTGFNTGRRNISILEQLSAWSKKNKLGIAVDSDTGFYLPNGAMRNPDAAWVSHERLKKVSKEDLEKFPHLCPDFIVELRSKGYTIKELREKMSEWIVNGCRLGWLIDADEEIVYVYRSGKRVATHTNFNKSISGEPELPGFKLLLSELRV